MLKDTKFYHQAQAPYIFQHHIAERGLGIRLRLCSSLASRLFSFLKGYLECTIVIPTLWEKVILIEDCLHVIGSHFIVTVCIIMTNDHNPGVVQANNYI